MPQVPYEMKRWYRIFWFDWLHIALFVLVFGGIALLGEGARKARKQTAHK